MGIGYFTYEARPGELVDIRWRRCRFWLVLSVIPLVAALAGSDVLGHVFASVPIAALSIAVSWAVWLVLAIHVIPRKTGMSPALSEMFDEIMYL